MAYKRAPIMTADERARAVENCKFVSKVIRNPPCTKGALTEEFIRKHNIHIVVAGFEYDDSPENVAKRGEDLWYKAPRDMGILKYIPRTEGVSTSTLIKRIQERYEEEGADKPKDKAEDKAEDKEEEEEELPPALQASPEATLKKKKKNTQKKY